MPNHLTQMYEPTSYDKDKVLTEKHKGWARAWSAIKGFYGKDDIKIGDKWRYTGTVNAQHYFVHNDLHCITTSGRIYSGGKCVDSVGEWADDFEMAEMILTKSHKGWRRIWDLLVKFSKLTESCPNGSEWYYITSSENAHYFRHDCLHGEFDGKIYSGECCDYAMVRQHNDFDLIDSVEKSNDKLCSIAAKETKVYQPLMNYNSYYGLPKEELLKLKWRF